MTPIFWTCVPLHRGLNPSKKSDRWWMTLHDSRSQSLGVDILDKCTAGCCQECLQNSALFAQFPLSFLTYVLLSYFVHLHCANIHILLPSFSFLMTFTDLKWSTWPDKAVYGATLSVAKDTGQTKLYSTTSSYSVLSRCKYILYTTQYSNLTS